MKFSLKLTVGAVFLIAGLLLSSEVINGSASLILTQSKNVVSKPLSKNVVFEDGCTSHETVNLDTLPRVELDELKRMTSPEPEDLVLINKCIKLYDPVTEITYSFHAGEEGSGFNYLNGVYDPGKNRPFSKLTKQHKLKGKILAVYEPIELRRVERDFRAVAIYQPYAQSHLVINRHEGDNYWLSLSQRCVMPSGHCKGIAKRNMREYPFQDYYKFFTDEDLILNNKLYKKYFPRKVKLEVETYEYLEDLLYPLPTKVFIDYVIDSSNRDEYFWSSSYTIGLRTSVERAQTYMTNLSKGNTHEYVHIFQEESPIERERWWKEGMAEFITEKRSFETDPYGRSYNCGEDGWQYGHFEEGEFYPRTLWSSETLTDEVSVIVPYADLSGDPLEDAEVDSQYSERSFYNTASCLFWTINNDYGEEVMQSVFKKIGDVRYDLPATEPLSFVEDILVPVIEGEYAIDIREIANERFGMY